MSKRPLAITLTFAALGIVLAGCEAEHIDAIYYPDKTKREQRHVIQEVLNLDDCRRAVRTLAAKLGDPEFERGDYECAIGPHGERDDPSSYDEIVK